MKNTPNVNDANSSQSVVGHELRTAAAILTESTKVMEKSADIYGTVKMGGFLVISGFTMGIVTIALSFLTGTGEGESWFGITYKEEILFTILSIGFAGFGVIIKSQYNSQKTQIRLDCLKIDGELNRYVHEETLTKLRLRGSKSPNDANTPATHNGTNGPSSGPSPV